MTDKLQTTKEKAILEALELCHSYAMGSATKYCGRNQAEKMDFHIAYKAAKAIK